MNKQNAKQRNFAFQSRQPIIPKPPKKGGSTLSRIASLFRSKAPKTEPAGNTGPIQSRDLLALRRSWDEGNEVDRVFEKRISVYFSNLAKAQRMDTVLWARDFQRFLDSSKGCSDSSAGAPALLQKIRIISSCEKAILAFSARCAKKAESIARLKEDSQLKAEDGLEEKLRKEIPALIELKVLLEQVSSFMKGDALATLEGDIQTMAESISSLQNGQGPREAIVPEEPGPDSNDSPAMAG